MLLLSAVFWLQSASFKISVCCVYTQLYMIPVEEGKSAGIDAINTTRSISVTALIVFLLFCSRPEWASSKSGKSNPWNDTHHSRDYENCKKKKKKIQMFVRFYFFCVVKLVYFMLWMCQFIVCHSWIFFLFDLQKSKNPQWFKIRCVAWWLNCVRRLQSESEGSYLNSALVYADCTFSHWSSLNATAFHCFISKGSNWENLHSWFRSKKKNAKSKKIISR